MEKVMLLILRSALLRGATILKMGQLVETVLNLPKVETLEVMLADP
jgi:hypothetical protein